MPADITEDLFAFTDAALKNANTRQAAIIDIGINCVAGNNIIDIDNFTHLATAVDTTDSLLNAHRVPGQIIVDHGVTELVVQAFGANFCEQQHINCFRVVLRKLKTVAKLESSVIADAAIDLFNTNTGCFQLLFYVIQGIAECAENDDFVIIRLLLFLNDFKHTVKLGIFWRKIVCQL